MIRIVVLSLRTFMVYGRWDGWVSGGGWVCVLGRWYTYIKGTFPSRPRRLLIFLLFFVRFLVLLNEEVGNITYIHAYIYVWHSFAYYVVSGFLYGGEFSVEKRIFFFSSTKHVVCRIHYGGCFVRALHIYVLRCWLLMGRLWSQNRCFFVLIFRAINTAVVAKSVRFSWAKKPKYK